MQKPPKMNMKRFWNEFQIEIMEAKKNSKLNRFDRFGC